MSEPTIIIAVLKALWTPVVWLRHRLGRRFRWLQARLQDPARHRFFPSDFSAVIKLQAPQATVRSVLGEPNYELYDRWTYLYREACLQLVFREKGGSLETIIVGFTGDSTKDRVPLRWLDAPLGGLNLEQALRCAMNGLDSIEFDDHMRVPGLRVQARLGPPGAWQYLTFGAMRPIYGGLTESRFEWDREAGRLTTAPRDILVNWTAISSSSFTNSWFDVGATIPSH